jgi:sec-independent protein translocase protein TatA
MSAVAQTAVILAVLNLGSGEIILILALVLTLFGREKLPDLMRGLGRGLIEFRKATRDVSDALDDEAGDAGRALGGICGKPAAQALTPNNQVAELYDPAAFQNRGKPRPVWTRVTRLLRRLWRLVCRFVRAD